jgi:hypothetical protein
LSRGIIDVVGQEMGVGYDYNGFGWIRESFAVYG